MTRTIVLTGASSGIGRKAAIALAEGGAHIAVVGRNPERTKAVADQVGGRAFVTDFDELDAIRALADDLLAAYPTIDVLANNAGGLVSKRALTANGYERTLQSNHLAPFLLTRLLLPRLLESQGRVVSTASTANLMGHVRLDDLNWGKRPWFGGWQQYGTSKILTIMFIQQLAERAAIDAFSFHPGFVSTGFGQDSVPIKVLQTVTGGNYGISADAGAVPLIQLAGPTVIGVPSGTYFDQLKPFGLRSSQTRNDQLAEAVWERSSELVGVSADL